MKTTLSYIVYGIMALAIGVGGMYAAKQMGWIGGPGAPIVTEPTPARVATASNIEVTPIDRSSLELIPRSQREPSATCTNTFVTVTLKSPLVAQRTGLKTERVERRTVRDVISANAEVDFAGDHYAHLAARAPGIVSSVNAELGQQVTAGEVLAVIDSTELGSAKAAYLQARSLVDLRAKTYAREQALFEKSVSTERELLEAETSLVESNITLSSASQRLRNLGLSEEAIVSIVDSNDTSSALPLRSPFAGTIVARHAARGEVITTSEPLFAIADTTHMWVMLDVYEADVARLRIGQRLELSLDGLPGQTREGVLTWISASIDPTTRTVKARAELDNTDGMLRAHMFGNAQIEVETIEDALLVPDSAVQWDGCCNIVFVKHTDTVFQPYKVTLGPKQKNYFIVLEGLPAGETVVTQGSFLLKTEILKGNIGAGCCETDPGANKVKEKG